jgi:hypothetical protein
MTVFEHFEMQIELLLQSRVLFDSCRSMSGGNAELIGNPGATIPWKTQSFAPESAFTREFTRFQTLSLPNYLMMGFSWWCGWHDGVSAGHVRRRYLGSLLTKLLLAIWCYSTIWSSVLNAFSSSLVLLMVTILASICIYLLLMTLMFIGDTAIDPGDTAVERSYQRRRSRLAN